MEGKNSGGEEENKGKKKNGRSDRWRKGLQRTIEQTRIRLEREHLGSNDGPVKLEGLGRRKGVESIGGGGECREVKISCCC